MQEAGVSVDDLKRAGSTPELRRVIERMLGNVDELLTEAEPITKMIRTRSLAREAGGILAIAKALSRALRKNDPLMKRVELSKLEMALRFIWGALRA